MMNQIEMDAKSFHNVIEYASEAAIKYDEYATTYFESHQRTLNEAYLTLFYECEAKKSAFLEILDAFNEPFTHIVMDGKIVNFEDEV